MELEGIFQKRAKEQQGKRTDLLEISPKSIDHTHGGAFPELNPINTRVELAKIAKVSDNTIAKVKVIEQKATPEVKKELETGTKSINEVYKEIKIIDGMGEHNRKILFSSEHDNWGTPEELS